MDFRKKIIPFIWNEYEEGASVCLNTGFYMEDIFISRKEDGFIGNGYDWAALAEVFLNEKCSKLLKNKIQFDPEAGMFCAYSKDPLALREFIQSFKIACENKELILDILSRAKIY